VNNKQAKATIKGATNKRRGGCSNQPRQLLVKVASLQTARQIFVNDRVRMQCRKRDLLLVASFVNKLHSKLTIFFPLGIIYFYDIFLSILIYYSSHLSEFNMLYVFALSNFFPSYFDNYESRAIPIDRLRF
jgi:hypothetical protein